MHQAKHLFFAIVLIFCSFFASAFEINRKENPKQVKVLSYNLRFGELASLQELADFIKQHNPDVVALQEVDSRTFRERAVLQNDKDFATELGYLTGMFAAYGKAIPYRNGYYGVAILSKYPMAKVERFYLPKTENGKEQRVVLVADIEYSENEYFTFASTHLDYTNTEERQVQVKKLNEILLPSKYPVILGGDFNGKPDAKEITEGMKDWERVSLLNPTVPADKPRNTIDYIFCYPKSKWTKINAETYQVTLSDHLPISATVEMK